MRTRPLRRGHRRARHGRRPARRWPTSRARLAGRRDSGARHLLRRPDGRPRVLRGSAHPRGRPGRRPPAPCPGCRRSTPTTDLPSPWPRRAARAPPRSRSTPTCRADGRGDHRRGPPAGHPGLGARGGVPRLARARWSTPASTRSRTSACWPTRRSDAMPRAYHHRAPVEAERVPGRRQSRASAPCSRRCAARAPSWTPRLWVYRRDGRGPRRPSRRARSPTAAPTWPSALASQAYRAGVLISAGTDGFSAPGRPLAGAAGRAGAAAGQGRHEAGRRDPRGAPMVGAMSIGAPGGRDGHHRARASWPIWSSSTRTRAEDVARLPHASSLTVKRGAPLLAQGLPAGDADEMEPGEE